MAPKAKTPKSEQAAAPKTKAAAAPKAKAKEEVQEAPKQETLEETPIAATGTYYGSMPSMSIKYPSPEEIDARMPKKLRDACNEWLVGVHQFDEMENAGGTLVCARVLRAFLIFFIVSSSIGLCVGFFFKASLSAPVETEQYASLPAPNVVFCASPWGTDFLGFDVIAVQEGLVPGKAFKDLQVANWSLGNFNSTLGHESADQLTGCKIISLIDVNLKAHGKVAQYTSFETIRLRINAQSEDGKFNFGFCNSDNELPQRWSYGALGDRLTGEIKYDQVNVGASDVSEGTPRSILSFKTTGTISLGTKTELEYFYGYFMVRVLSAQAKGLTVFAIVAFVLLLAAAVNNCGLFDLFFTEFVADDEEPPALVPNLVCQAVCGQAFGACRRRKADPAAEGADDEKPEEKAETA